LRNLVFSKKRAPIKILDIGCSYGDFTVELWKMNKEGKTIGIDITEIGIYEARRRYPMIDFKVAALPEVEIEENDFDLITCLESIYYIPMDGRIAGLKRIKELLKDDGYFLISVPHARNHPLYFTKESFFEFITSEFELIHREYNYGGLYYFFEIPLFRTYWRAVGLARKEKWKKKLGPIHRLVKPMALFIAKWIRFILSLKYPAIILFYLGRKLFPARSITHSIALCKKK
ncbi:MAG: class I SAM-dependent methyltransferase, partial [bacterium]